MDGFFASAGYQDDGVVNSERSEEQEGKERYADVQRRESVDVGSPVNSRGGRCFHGSVVSSWNLTGRSFSTSAPWN